MEYEWIDLTLFNNGEQFTSSTGMNYTLINAIINNINYIKQTQEV